MASEKNIFKTLEQAGLSPHPNQAIIVKYAPENLSEQVADFFNMEFYVLQLCENELVLLPFHPTALSLKKEVSLTLPYCTLRAVQLEEEGFNTRITLTTDTDTIRLTTQQKQLSDFRSAGILSLDGQGLKLWSWHKENFDGTLAALKQLP